MSESNGCHALGRDGLMALRPPAPLRVDLEEGGCVHVRMLSPRERDLHENAQYKVNARTGEAEFVAGGRARLVALCACDESGRRLFSDDDEQAIDRGELSPLVVDQIVAAATKFNRIGAHALRAAEKNSETTAASASSSSSPGT